ncbi:hypothetical protein [Pedobacter rhizosphaerae]|uniref:Lipocalin-like domain-containing protein n=1 Tax=Pedobacter rhizosphaerae TaxID=390241 RepID=A0A1H9VK10_9SPHI|nr:hypothetical protein [Pedobacter rhizosphaerae]SES22080.1 hypothetical protein SAMN04488023_14419 [Pedobacter rhizosphaerae]
MKNAFKIFVFTIFASIAITSCKKEKLPQTPTTSDSLVGNWRETNTGSVLRRISFGVGLDFSMVTVLDNTHSTSLHGKYTVNGNAVDIVITESVSRNGDKSVTTVVNQKVYDKASFTVKDDKLTLNFIGFPADQLTAGKATFDRFIMTD